MLVYLYAPYFQEGCSLYDSMWSLIYHACDALFAPVVIASYHSSLTTSFSTVHIKIRIDNCFLLKNLTYIVGLDIPPIAGQFLTISTLLSVCLVQRAESILHRGAFSFHLCAPFFPVLVRQNSSCHHGYKRLLASVRIQIPIFSINNLLII
jgi:hypothetical protein